MRPEETVFAEIELIDPKGGRNYGLIPEVGSYVVIDGTSYHTSLDHPIEVIAKKDELVAVTVTLLASKLTIGNGE